MNINNLKYNPITGELTYKNGKKYRKKDKMNIIWEILHKKPPEKDVELICPIRPPVFDNLKLKQEEIHMHKDITYNKDTKQYEVTIEGVFYGGYTTALQAEALRVSVQRKIDKRNTVLQEQEEKRLEALREAEEKKQKQEESESVYKQAPKSNIEVDTYDLYNEFVYDYEEVDTTDTSSESESE